MQHQHGVMHSYSYRTKLNHVIVLSDQSAQFLLNRSSTVDMNTPVYLVYNNTVF